MTSKTETPSKADTVKKLLGRPNGATLADMEKATGWKPHSVRAFLSGLRKKNVDLVREKRKSGKSAWRIKKA